MSDANSSSESPSSASSPATQPTTIVIQQSGFSRTLGRIFFWGGWLGFIACLIIIGLLRSEREAYYDRTGGIRERFHSGSKSAESKIAIISIRGVIMDGDGFVKRQIDRIRDDKNVKAIVLRVESPGGTVAGSDYIYHHLDKLRREKNIPLVVSMGSIAASGGYYVAMAVGDQEDSIFAEPTTVTGSIGVIIPHYDLHVFLEEKLKIKNNSIASGDRKQMLSMTKEMTPEHREILQGHVNDFFRRFKKVITFGRPAYRTANEESEDYPIADVATGRDLATGEVFTAYRAKEFGLVDKIGFIEDAIARATELADLNAEDVRVVSFQRPPTLMDLAGISAQDQRRMDLSMFLELSSPRAYYLASSLPPLVSSRRAD